MGVRDYPDVPRVYIDQDGPMAQLEEAATAAGLSIKEFKCNPDAYLHLPVEPGVREAIAELTAMGLLVFVMTKIPLSNPRAATEKLLWVGREFPPLLDRTIITPDKGAVGTFRDFLVDDHPEWANAHNFPGTILVYTRNWPAIVEQIRASVGMLPDATRAAMTQVRAAAAVV
jgi:5'(3')-deoxyribonucleotidase